ncbi:MAG: SMP-30/gluconolactonase/LRE family protein [Salinibacterium amurskyense]
MELDNTAPELTAAPGWLPIGPRAEFGEGPAWDSHRGVLWWVDIPAGAVHATDPARDQTKTLLFESPVSAVWPVSDGRIALATGRTILLVDPDTSQSVVFATVDAPESMRLNDGGISPAGDLWVGTMTVPPSASAAGGFWHINAQGTSALRIDNVALANGISWNPAGDLLYVADTLAGTIDSYPVHGDELGSRRSFVQIEDHDGAPDGITVDAEGGVWVALAGGGALRRYLPSGVLDRTVVVPTRSPTSCTFGGAALETLFVTTAGAAHSHDQSEQAGYVLALDVGVSGSAPTPLQLDRCSSDQPTQ